MVPCFHQVLRVSSMSLVLYFNAFFVLLTVLVQSSDKGGWVFRGSSAVKSCCIHISFVPCAADWIVTIPISHLRALMSIIRAEFLSIQNKQNENIYWGSSWLCPLFFLDDERSFWKSWSLPGWECLGWVHALSQCDWPHVASWIWQNSGKPCSWGAVFCVCVERVWEWVGYKSSLGGPWHPAKVSRAVILPAGEFCIAKAQEDHVPVTAQRCWAGKHHLSSFVKAFPSRRDTVQTPSCPYTGVEWAYPSADWRNAFRCWISTPRGINLE